MNAGSCQLLGWYRGSVKLKARVLFRRPARIHQLVRIEQKLGAQARRSDHEALRLHR
ncbi:hypothetical protein [Streptomyces griseoviridis]|uniref:hypothetical protein n=1 Tax=Streptomyces griseoviridis TaxID=45398 RepID=UPI0034320236